MRSATARGWACITYIHLISVMISQLSRRILLCYSEGALEMNDHLLFELHVYIYNDEVFIRYCHNQ